jgi:UDP-N-acetylglucosamine 2-epimerase (non-hydrolysing)
MSHGVNPYGDGRASQRIVEAICRWARGVSPLLAPEEAFSSVTPMAVA